MTDLAALHQLLDHDLHWSGPGMTLEQRRERLQREISLAQWELRRGTVCLTAPLCYRLPRS